MDCHFPTINTLEKNVPKLVEIFGTYVVYCLIEAARLITDNKNNQEEHWHSSYFGDRSNFRDGKFREGKLVSTWIKDIFNPWHMLNLFLTAVSNPADNKRANTKNRSKNEEILLRDYFKEYEKDNLSRISGISVDSILNTKQNKKESKIPHTTLDLLFMRAATTSTGVNNNKESLDILMQNKGWYHFLKIKSQYNEDNLLYELDPEKIKKIKNTLKKEYPLYYKGLQKTDKIFYSK